MRILVLSPWFPYPPDNGAKTRVYNLARHLAKEHEVTLAVFAAAGADRSGLSFCSEVATVDQDPFSKHRLQKSLSFLSRWPIVTYPIKAMSRLVDSLLRKGEFSAAIAFTSVMAPYLTGTTIPKVLDIDTGLTGFAMERWRMEHTTRGKLWAWLSLQKTISFEREVVGRFDGTVVLTEISYNSLKPVVSKAKRLAIIGNGVDLAYYPFKSHEPEPNTLIYSGALTFLANYDAMQWFLHNIFPLIKAEIPTTTLRITGRLNGVNLESLRISDDVVLTGYIQDIRPAVTKSWACIVPLCIGGGQRMKILEAMALGTPVVSTSKGIEGLEISHGEHALIADEPCEFAKATILLLRDTTLRNEIVRNARSLMERQYSWESILPQFQSFIDSMLRDRER
jgi:glycosyltransferase involved in cell wall biosynthesis